LEVEHPAFLVSDTGVYSAVCVCPEIWARDLCPESGRTRIRIAAGKRNFLTSQPSENEIGSWRWWIDKRGS